MVYIIFNMSKNYNPYLSTSELAKILNVSRIAIFNRIRSGKIVATKAGRNYIIKKTDLPELFENNIKDYGQKNIYQSISKRAAALLFNLAINYPFNSHKEIVCTAQLVLFLFKNGYDCKLNRKATVSLFEYIEKSSKRKKSETIKAVQKVILDNISNTGL